MNTEEILQIEIDELLVTWLRLGWQNRQPIDSIEPTADRESFRMDIEMSEKVTLAESWFRLSGDASETVKEMGLTSAIEFASRKRLLAKAVIMFKAVALEIENNVKDLFKEYKGWEFISVTNSHPLKTSKACGFKDLEQGTANRYFFDASNSVAEVVEIDISHNSVLPSDLSVCMWVRFDSLNQLVA
ncbi:MAG: hypothetical protein EOP04_01950 [Proteobacteria bacterium]|nr:MAG: hypothetical protein EOP04_01950 [Pseudomonadota bacterium]